MTPLETFIKLNLQTAGRDKLARLIQYGSRAAWFYIQQWKVSPLTVDKLKTLEYNLSTFRKLLRLGRFLDVLYGALSSIHYQDLTLRLTCTLSKISNALFLLADHMIWLGRSGFKTVDTDKWSKLSNKYWLYSITMNLVRDVYEIMKIIDQEKIKVRYNPNGEISPLIFLSKNITPVTLSLVNNHRDVFWDTVKNSCDVWIPLNGLGYTNLKPGTIGILGFISSIAGIISLISPAAKLIPS